MKDVKDTELTERELSTLIEMMDPERLDRMDRVLDGRLRGLTVLLEDVYKPQNMGACIRTLEALGIQDVHVVDGSADFVPNRKVTQGCDKWVDLHHHTSATEAARALRARGYRVLATSLEATSELHELDFSTPVALCFGNELKGITDELASEADETFRIPMFGFTQSFNLSVAVGMCMQTAANARRQAIQASGDLSDDEKAALKRRWIPLARKNAGEILAALSTRPEDP
jgi:tRNA (guanosine-2'-O-)-methyltransferase